MSVKGKIITEGVKVQLEGQWPDYVFKPTYNLNGLEQVKSFIEANGHLPKMPAASVVEREGIDDEQMNVLLVEKIEELTLYLIQLEERLKKLEASKP